jgi:hypothetical protein
MTTRRWIVATAFVAMPLSVANGLAERRAYFLTRAAYHRQMAIDIDNDYLIRSSGGCPFTFESLLHGRTESKDKLAADNLPKAKTSKPNWAEEMTRMQRSIDYHTAMERKFENAARRPWLPVAPDPPEPNQVTPGASPDL